jgi:hypothetical protein
VTCKTPLPLNHHSLRARLIGDVEELLRAYRLLSPGESKYCLLIGWRAFTQQKKEEGGDSG